MKTLTELSAELAVTEAVANKDITTVDPRARSGWEGKKNQAKAELDDLNKQFRDVVVKSSAGIFVSGPETAAKELAQIAENEGNAVTVRADEIYRRVADPVNKMMGSNRVFNVSQASRIIQEVADIARDLQLAEITNPMSASPTSGIVLKDHEAVVVFVREAIRKTNGDVLNQAYLERQVADKVSHGYGQNIVPVSVLGATKEEIQGDLFRNIFRGNNFVINTGENADPNKVVKVFNKIKARFQPGAENSSTKE